MMFQKGRAKTGGRKKGVCNKNTRTQRGVLAMILEDNFSPEQIQALLAGLSPREQLQFYVQTLPFVAPKLTAASVAVETKETDTPLEELLTTLAGGEEPTPAT